jgi:hypothetical protein
MQKNILVYLFSSLKKFEFYFCPGSYASPVSQIAFSEVYRITAEWQINLGLNPLVTLSARIPQNRATLYQTEPLQLVTVVKVPEGDLEPLLVIGNDRVHFARVIGVFELGSIAQGIKAGISGVVRGRTCAINEKFIMNKRI